MLRVARRLSVCRLPVARVSQWHLAYYASDASKPAEETITPAMIGRARSIAAEHESLEKQLAKNYDIDTAKKAGALSATANALKAWKDANESLDTLDQLLHDPATDDELREITLEEIADNKIGLVQASKTLKTSLVPVHPFAHLPCLLELKPGAGGSEAAIFAGDLLRMYQAFCKRHGRRVDILSLNSAEGAGEKKITDAVIEIEGEGAYELLRSEAGVHRVQRVPATESKGRTHTSAVSVIVLPSFPPNAADILGESSFDDPNSDYYIDPKDVRTDVMRASGAGGQHVNKTDSAIRLTHGPTGMVVSMQESRSQHQNKDKAWQVLRSRIAQARREAREEEMASMRRSVVGVAKLGRGDKIRTYNWSQARVTDHRSGYSVQSLDDVMAGGMELDEVMQSVRAWMVEQELLAMTAEDADK